MRNMSVMHTKCPVCEGSGSLETWGWDSDDVYRGYLWPCPDCGGSGVDKEAHDDT